MGATSKQWRRLQRCKHREGGVSENESERDGDKIVTKIEGHRKMDVWLVGGWLAGSDVEPASSQATQR